MGSSRLPGKTMMKLHNNSVTLDSVINQLSFSKLIEKVVIATTTLEEDPELIKINQNVPKNEGLLKSLKRDEEFKNLIDKNEKKY